MREFIIWKDYLNDFYRSLDKDGRRKVLWMLKSLASLPKIPSKFFKHIAFSAFLTKAIKSFYVMDS
jgi:hypothetical protein